MPLVRCTVEASPTDPEEVRVSLINEDRKIASFVDLDGPSIEQLIGKLARARSRLSDPVPETLDPHPRFDKANVSAEPSFQLFGRMRRRDGQAEIPLALRHPGLGWVMYLFSPERAANLGRALILRSRQSETAVAKRDTSP